MFNWLLQIGSLLGLVLGLLWRAVRVAATDDGRGEAALMTSLRQRYPEAPQPWLDLVARNTLLASTWEESAAKPPQRPEFLPPREAMEPSREGRFRVVSETPTIERPRFTETERRVRASWRWHVIEEDRRAVTPRLADVGAPLSHPSAVRFREAVASDAGAPPFAELPEAAPPQAPIRPEPNATVKADPVAWMEPSAGERDDAAFEPPLPVVETELLAFEQEVGRPRHKPASFHESLPPQEDNRTWSDEPRADLWPALLPVPKPQPPASLLDERIRRLRQIQARR
jgi:hypothetical protein